MSQPNSDTCQCQGPKETFTVHMATHQNWKWHLFSGLISGNKQPALILSLALLSAKGGEAASRQPRGWLEHGAHDGSDMGHSLKCWTPAPCGSLPAQSVIPHSSMAQEAYKAFSQNPTFYGKVL